MNEQGELFVDHRFFVLLSSLVSSGQMARLKPHAVAVLVVLRCFADYRTGKSKVSHRTIAKYSGISRHSVMRALDVLEENRLIERIKAEHGDSYKIVDRVSVFDADEKEVGEVIVPLKPQKTSQMLQEIKRFIETGEVSTEAAKMGMVFNINITINNQTTNIQHADNVQITLTNGSSTEKAPSRSVEEQVRNIMRLPSGPMRELALKVLNLPDDVVEAIHKAKAPPK